MVRRIASAVVAVVVAVVLFVLLLPQALGLQWTPVIAQAVSLRAIELGIALVLAILVGIVALAWRGGRVLFAPVAILLLAFAVATGGILIARGYGGSTVSASAKGAHDITILSWNTKGSAPGSARIAELALAEKADVVVLPETEHSTGIAVAEQLRAAGHPMEVLWSARGYIYQSHATTLLISTSLGRYHVNTEAGDTSILPTVVAVPDDRADPTIVAVHAVSPKPDEMRNWNSDLHFLSRLCRGPDTIMSGDFNATLDTLQPLSAASGDDFGQCRDSGLATGSAAVASWPTSLPELLGAQIDHVMFGSSWRAVAFHVIGTEDDAGSDHRPVVATLAPNS